MILFKKIATIALTVAFCLTLAACGANNNITERKGDENCKHLWVKETHDKNRCTEKTVITQTCEKCGKREILSETLPLGHYYPPNYASEKNVCTTCGIKVDTDCKHENIRVNRVREVTCTINGEDHHICTKCFFNIESEMIKAFGHDEIEYEEKEPTCTEGGNYHCFVCTTCGYSNVEYMQREPLGHDYANGVCSRCGDQQPD